MRAGCGEKETVTDKGGMECAARLMHTATRLVLHWLTARLVLQPWQKIVNAERLNAISVRVGQTYPARDPADGVVARANEECAWVSGTLPAGATRLACARPITGRFVSVQIIGKSGTLTLCEVQFHVAV
jgi:hypothetical protein